MPETETQPRKVPRRKSRPLIRVRKQNPASTAEAGLRQARRASVQKVRAGLRPSPVPMPERYPDELRKEKEEKIQDANEKSEEIRDGIAELFFGAGTAITPDYLGVMNSTSEYFCHYLPSKKPIAASVMFGNRQKMASKVVDVLKNRI